MGGYGVWIPDWNKQGEAKQERAESSYHGPANGQTGSSTRQELMAWIRVLGLPYRTMYATDSACMLGKAKKLIEVARQFEEKSKGEGRAPSEGKQMRNPFKKP